MIDAVRRYDGYVVESTGDGVFAMFGAPVAHEDHPQRALYAALRMQEELRRYGAKLQADDRAPIEIRVGVNTDEVVVRSIATGGTQVQYPPIGHTTNLASRMQTVAAVGSIAVTEATRKLCEGYFILKPLGATKVKGVGGPVNVYEVVGDGPLRGHFELATRRGLTKFIGRDFELEQMKRALKRASAGQGQLIAVVAEPGTGKSRLFHEFKATLPGECKLLEAYSVSHGKSYAYLPVLALLGRYFGIEEGDDRAERREKIQSRLNALDPALSEALPYLLGLLGVQDSPDPLAQMDSRVKRRRTLEAIKGIIFRESLNQPMVIVFEDLHWIDTET
jgi:hypothetical protein